MSIISDLLKRKKIDSDVLQTINTCFSKLAIKNLEDANDKKKRKKFEQIITRLKVELKNYMSDEQLGVYGISRVMKTVQNHLLSQGFDSDMVKGVIEDLMLR